MAYGHAAHRLNQLWQVPLLLLSLGLFGYAAYLFINPHGGLTLDQKIAYARAYIKNDRATAAIDLCNHLLETEKLDHEHEAAIHLVLAEALAAAQRDLHIEIPTNRARIVDQVNVAFAEGAKPTGEIYRLLGESYEALHDVPRALDSYRRAEALDDTKSIALQRKVVELQLDQHDVGPAEASLNEYLKSKELTDTERAWAVQNKAQLLIDRGDFAGAKALLAQCLKLDPDPVNQGVVNYRLGFCAWKLGDQADAERLLRVSRDQMHTSHPLDAEAAYLLGVISRDRGEFAVAASFFQDVLTSHPESDVAVASRVGRGYCRIMQGQDATGLADLRDAIGPIAAAVASNSLTTAQLELISGTSEACKRAAVSLSDRQNFAGAIEVLADEQSLRPNPPIDFFDRLANVYIRRADQLEAIDHVNDGASAAERIRRQQDIRDARMKGAAASIAYSRALTTIDDKGYAAALWRGVNLFDQAGDEPDLIAALELFVAERPNDPLAADALLRLGQAYQATGQFDKAVIALQRDQFRYPNTLAASKSAIPLAQAYIAKGPGNYARAESVLNGVIEGNLQLSPEAAEYRDALFELAKLYYRTSRFEEAESKLQELLNRYPDDSCCGQFAFSLADSYRKGAGMLDVKLALATKSTGPSAAAEAAEAAAAKRQLLTQAKATFDRVVDFYQATTPATDADRLDQRLAHFYRADCLYDLGDYDGAIKSYDVAASRYRDDPSALAAYVQIVNSYCALGQMQEAKAANERAKWLLRRMPADAFTDGSFSMPKEYWEQWLKWTSTSGMW